MAVVTMTAIWERTQAVGSRRLGALAAIALAAVWLPGLIQLATRLALIGPAPTVATGAGAGAAALVALLGVVTSLVALVGTLALVALGADPSLPVAAALRIGVKRLLPMLGLVLVVVTVPILAAAPGLATMRASAAPDITPGASMFVRWYCVLLLVALLWVEARIVLLLSPIIVEERLGLGAFRRALLLTRGLTWRIIGAILLFVLVAGVAVLAARSVAGVAAWLIFDGVAHPRLVQFVASAVASLVATGFAAVAAVFAAQLYLVLAGTTGGVRVASVPTIEPAGAAAAPATVKAGPWG